jgi:hypothetical protein
MTTSAARFPLALVPLPAIIVGLLVALGGF